MLYYSALPNGTRSCFIALHCDAAATDALEQRKRSKNAERCGAAASPVRIPTARDEIVELDRIADQRSYDGTTRNGCDHLPTYMPFSIRNSPILVKVAVAVAASDCSGQPYGGNSSYGIDVFF